MNKSQNLILALLFSSLICLAQCDNHQDHNDPSKNKTEGKCFGLALSEGADYGPYQAGAINGLISNQSLTNFTYHTVSGVGLGGLNAFIMALYEVGNETTAVEALAAFWRDLAARDNQQLWSSSYFYGVFLDGALYDTAGLNKFVEAYFKSNSVKRELNIGLSNFLDGTYHLFTEKVDYEEIIRVVKASIAYPGVSKPQEFREALWFTGSTIYEVDITSIINDCEELGYDEQDVVIDVIISGTPVIDHVFSKYFNAFQVLGRSVDLMNHYERLFGVIRAQQGHPEVSFRYIIGPSGDVPSKSFPMDYTPEEVESLLALGKKDAVNTIKYFQTHGGNKDFLDFVDKEYFEDVKLKQQQTLTRKVVRFSDLV